MMMKIIDRLKRNFSADEINSLSRSGNTSDGQHLDIRDIIDDVMDGFDFDKVHRMMTAVNWTWGGEEQSPCISELRASARRNLRRAHECCLKHCEAYTVSSGGFTARVDYDDEVDNFYVYLSWGVDNNNVY
jgi:hypothetical protein